MDNVIGIALATVATIGLTIVLKCSIIALNLWFAATWPEKTEKLYEAYVQRPWRCALIGCVNTLVLVFIGLVLMNAGPLALIGMLMLLGVTCLHIWGRTATYRRMAEKLKFDEAGGHAPKALVLGGIVTELVFLSPVIGQLMYVGVTMRAMGAAVVALLSRKKKEIVEPPVEDENQ